MFVHFAFAYVTGFEDYRTTLKSYDCLWIRMSKVIIDSSYLLSHIYKFCYFWLQEEVKLLRTIEKLNPLFWGIVTFGWVDTAVDPSY